MEKIRAAVVGLGRIGSLLEEDSLREKPCTHTGAIAANPDCVLAAGCDLDGERRKQYSEKWQVPVYADAAEMLRIHKPQILAIATHPDSHWCYCRLAALNGVPVVICEKPLADNIRRARKIARLAAGHTKLSAGNQNQRRSVRGAPEKAPVIITNHERRYSQNYINAKAILEESVHAPDGGRLGRLLSVRANLCMGKNRRLLDVFWHDGTHLADAIMYLSGLVLKHRRRWGAKLGARSGTAWLEAELRSMTYSKIETDRQVLMEIGAGREPSNPQDDSDPIPVLIEIGAGRDHLVFEIEFSCEKGRLRIGNGVYEIWESVPSPYAENFRSLKYCDEVFEGPTGYFANMIKDAAVCLRESGRQPLSSAADGLRVIEYLNSVKVWRSGD